MAYLTLASLAERPGAQELAQVASDAHQAVVAADLMEATLRGADRSAWTAPEIALADQAKARIEQSMGEADGIIDGYLARRYTLPLASTPSLLGTWARAIVRYQLHGNRSVDERSDPIARDYRDAIKFLEQVAAGKFSLGLDDPATGASAPGEIQIEPGTKVFGRGVLP
jgi:phage gp36-like protein